VILTVRVFVAYLGPPDLSRRCHRGSYAVGIDSRCPFGDRTLRCWVISKIWFDQMMIFK